MAQVDKMGAAAAVAKCLEHLNIGADRPLHMSFDIDSIDPVQAPATGTPGNALVITKVGSHVLYILIAYQIYRVSHN